MSGEIETVKLGTSHEEMFETLRAFLANGFNVGIVRWDGSWWVAEKVS